MCYPHTDTNIKINENKYYISIEINISWHKSGTRLVPATVRCPLVSPSAFALHNKSSSRRYTLQRIPHQLAGLEQQGHCLADVGDLSQSRGVFPL